MKYVSVICPFHNDSKWLPRLIESRNSQTGVRFEVIFVNNLSNQYEEAALYRESFNLECEHRIIQTWGDRGFCYACNYGASVAQGEFLYFINPDCWLEPECLSWLSELYQDNRLSFCVLLDYDSQKRQCAKWEGFDVMGNSVHGYGGPSFSQSGFAFISREWFDKIGGFDSEQFMYGEEEDMSWRTWIMGGDVSECGFTGVHHRNHHSEYHATNYSRFLINRNCLYRICKNASSVLLLMLLPCSAWIFLEGLICLFLYGIDSFYWIGIKPFMSLVSIMGTISERRRYISQRRVRGDWWMIRNYFVPLRLGKMDEIRKVFKIGLPNL